MPGGKDMVLPACAGVILRNTYLIRNAKSFTRMRGGDPKRSNR